MKHALIGALVKYSGIGTLQRFVCARRRATIVIYHDPKPEILDSHLAWYARRYNFITLDQLADALESGHWKHLPDYPMVVTIDDGHRGNSHLASTLRRHGVRPMIYLCSQIVGTNRPYWWRTNAAIQLDPEALKQLPDEERRGKLAAAGDDPDMNGEVRQAMSWEEVSHLGSVTDYGAHTRSHPILPNCDDHRCEDEIALCKQELEAELGKPCTHFAFPNGDYGPREIEVLRRAGYRTARSIDPGWNGPNVDPMQLKAIPVSDDTPVGWLAVQMTGLPAWLRGRRNHAATESNRQDPDPLPAL